MRSKLAICRMLALSALAVLEAGPSSAARVAPLVADATTQRIIVKFRDDMPRAALSTGERVGLVAAEVGVALTPVRPMALGMHVLALDQPVGLSQARAIAARLAARPTVLYAEPYRAL